MVRESEEPVEPADWHARTALTGTHGSDQCVWGYVRRYARRPVPRGAVEAFESGRPSGQPQRRPGDVCAERAALVRPMAEDLRDLDSFSECKMRLY